MVTTPAIVEAPKAWRGAVFTHRQSAKDNRSRWIVAAVNPHKQAAPANSPRPELTQRCTVSGPEAMSDGRR